MSGWGSAVWPEDFGPPENLASGFPSDFFVFRGTDQKWGSVHAPERLVRQRPWPTIQGRLGDLEEAIAWFEHIASISGIMLLRLAPGTGQAGLYSLQERAIYLADELFELPPLYGWVLAHELGHAVDPRFEVFGAVEYGQAKYSHRTRDYELVAECAAVDAFFSFGLHPFRDNEYLASIAGKKWRKKLTGPRQGRPPTGGGWHPAQTAATRHPRRTAGVPQGSGEPAEHHPPPRQTTTTRDGCPQLHTGPVLAPSNTRPVAMTPPA